jgi:hypothetical protein
MGWANVSNRLKDSKPRFPSDFPEIVYAKFYENAVMGTPHPNLPVRPRSSWRAHVRLANWGMVIRGSFRRGSFHFNGATSTLRFSALPLAVALSATGRVAP